MLITLRKKRRNFQILILAKSINFANYWLGSSLWLPMFSVDCKENTKLNHIHNYMHYEAITIIRRTLRNLLFTCSCLIFCQIKCLKLDEMTACSFSSGIVLLLKGGSYQKIVQSVQNNDRVIYYYFWKILLQSFLNIAAHIAEKGG